MLQCTRGGTGSRQQVQGEASAAGNRRYCSQTRGWGVFEDFCKQGGGLLGAVSTILALAMAPGGAALGQEPGGSGSQARKTTSPIGEVIVTATKREESLQDVPISVGVLSGEAVAELGIKGFEDVQDYIPNLVIQETLGSYQIRMRGLGSGNSQLSFVSAVGIFVDGVYCGRPRCFQNPLFDIERVEVVRGPQGALFGKNTIAGAVSTISAGPTSDFQAEASAGVEMAEGGYNVSGYVSGPINDTLGFRLAAKHEDLDGFIKNTSTGKDENAVESDLVRGILEWTPSENLRVRLKAEWAQRDYDGYTAQNLALGGYGLPVPFSRPEKIDHDTSVLTIFPDGQWDNTDSSNYALQVDWDIGGFTLTSITGATSFEFLRRVTATAYTMLFVDTEIGENYEQYSQELRLASPTGGVFDYIVGAYYSQDHSKILQWSPYAFPPFTPGPPGSPTDPDTRVYSSGARYYHGDGDTISAYASGTFHFLEDRARLTLGLRLGEDGLDGHSWLTNGTYDRASNQFIPLPSDFVYIPPGASNREFNLYSDRDESYTLPSISFQYDLTDEVMGYVSYTEGFKGGGFIANDAKTGENVIAEVNRTTQMGVSSWAMEYAGMPTITDAQLLAGVTLKQGNGIYDYKPEKAESWEFGTKMHFLDGALTWNIALFHTKFDNLQTSMFDGVRFITRNAANDYKNTFCKVVTIDGVKAVPGCVDGQGDLSGEKLERAPEIEAALTADWNSPLTATTRLLLGGAVSYSDDYYLVANISPLYVQPAFTKVDLRAGVADADDRWEVMLIGRNITDQLTMQHAYQVGMFHGASVSTPRSVTLPGTWRFK
ncbi:MAG: TonB-dependent receptor [Gammaproteobacteria bacterium PRO9]|nr:TonB-dependent receptor [Gammaproteobacteria bacterium PRO9]